MNHQPVATNHLDRLRSAHLEIRSVFGAIKSTSNSRTNLADFREHFNRLVKAVSSLLSLLTRGGTPLGTGSTSSKPITRQSDEADFVNSINDEVSSIVLYVAEFIDLALRGASKNDINSLYYEFSRFVASLAEKSPFKIFESSNREFNLLVAIFLNMTFDALNQNTSEQSLQIERLKLVYELSRALGSLIYQNGSKLNDSNLNRLLAGVNNGLLVLLRSQVEKTPTQLSNSNKNENESTRELVDRIDLISVQLAYNLTIPTIICAPETNSTGQSNQAIQMSGQQQMTATAYEYVYIEDRFKAQVCAALMQIIRYHQRLERSIVTKDGEVTAGSLEACINRGKILSKALQGVENLFYSIKNGDGCNSGLGGQSSVTWIQLNENEFKLADILSIIKDFTCYGLPNTASSKTGVSLTKNEKQQSDDRIESLTGGDLDVYLKPSTTSKKNSGNKSDGGNQSNTDDDEANNDQQQRIGKSSSNKKKSNSEASNSKFNRNKKYSKFRHNQRQVDLNAIADSNINNSMICLKDPQVPLIQYSKSGGGDHRHFKDKNRENEMPRYGSTATSSSRGQNDSDTAASATDNASSAPSQFHVEKCYARVRIAALGCLLSAFQTSQQTLDQRRTIISYWSAFLANNKSSLVATLRQDCSPKVRLIAATTLAAYLDCVRMFFSNAATETSSTTPASLLANAESSASFLPISSTIAALIRQLHNELLRMACHQETFMVNQVQLFKAIQSLIRATPYQKGMKPGLLYKLIGHLCQFIDRSMKKPLNRDRCHLLAECLSCLELVLINNHQLVEVHLALMSQIDHTTAASNSLVDESKVLSHRNAESDDLSAKLERMMGTTGGLKLPHLAQSRVTYFYDKDSYQSSAHVSGQVTPGGSSSSSLFAANCFLNEESTGNNSTAPPSNKSWLVSFCLSHAAMSASATPSTAVHSPFVLKCFDLLSIVCKKYFDLLSRDLFFDQLSSLIVDNIDFTKTQAVNNVAMTSSTSTTCLASQQEIYVHVEQMRLKTLKLLEDFARSLATDELRALSGIDLNDCCKFWSTLLSSKLIPEYVCDEQRYMLASTACDCLASMGAAVFELLPMPRRIYCLTSLLHASRSLTSNSLRAAGVRALGVYVTYTSLKEDQNFLSDLSACLMGALTNETNNLVRQKTAWSMSNLSEVLIENGEKLGTAFTDEFHVSQWLRLIDTVSHTCRTDSDKIKSYLVRALGNLISYASLIDPEHFLNELGKSREVVERAVERAIDALCACRHVKMLKVKWNLSYAIGVATRRFGQWRMALDNPKWLLVFANTLLELFANSNNFKVRINACNALMTMNLNEKTLKTIQADGSQSQQSLSIYSRVWLSLVDAFARLDSCDAVNETQHKTTFEHQLCKMFTYLCKSLRLEDLETLMKTCLNDLKLNSINRVSNDPAKKTALSLDELRSYLIAYVWKIHDQIEQNKQEVQFYNDALVQLNLLNASKKSSLDEDCINLLTSVLQKRPRVGSSRADESAESSESESHGTTARSGKKFPFKQIYD